jgi:hypothetical protein
MAECSHGQLQFEMGVNDRLPPSAALPLVRGRRERSERGGRSHAISNQSWATVPFSRVRPFSVHIPEFSPNETRYDDSQSGEQQES